MTLISKEQLLDAVMKKSYSQASIQLINDQPEVEAIPIEWIRQWSSEWQGTEFVEMLIGDWEKEK